MKCRETQILNPPDAPPPGVFSGPLAFLDRETSMGLTIEKKGETLNPGQSGRYSRETFEISPYQTPCERRNYYGF